MFKQLLRKALWFPTGVASVTGTLYLAYFLYEKNRAFNTTLTIMPQEEEQDPSSAASPQDPSESGTTDEASESTNEADKEGDEDKEEDPQEPELPSESEESTEEPEAPSEPKEPKESEDSSSSMEGESTIEDVIRAKIEDLNKNGKLWTINYETELAAFWKINTTIADLLNAIKQLPTKTASEA